MRRMRGLTLVEVVVVIVLVVAVVSMVAPAMSRARGGSHRSYCASNLTGMYKSMYTYSVTNKDHFPIAGDRDPEADAIGFREGDRATGTGAVLDNNVTASLWIIVRDGSSSTGSFICTATDDEKDEIRIKPAGNAAALADSFDFQARRNLSYSPINMYHQTALQNWGSAAPGDYVLMGDNNANDSADPKRHTLAKGATVEDVEALENSPSHGYGGQNLMFGDGHVNFHNDPFQGRANENVHAITVNGVNTPPVLSNSVPMGANDTALLPLCGNGGVSLSGLALDYEGGLNYSRFKREQQRKMMIIAIGLLVLVVAALVIWVATTTRNARRHAAPVSDDVDGQ